MITEIAFIEVISENHTAFEVAVRKAVAEILPQAKGYVDFELQKGIEQPNPYCFHIRWETLEGHPIGFRESELFVQWRSIIGGYFAKPPIVEHWASV